MASDDIRPTQDDLARDLRADLAVAEKATPGPWQADIPAGHVWHPDWLKRGWDRGIIATTDWDEDTAAIATSREAWPAAIRRALAAEAEVERLRGEVDALEGVVRDESARSDDVVRSLTDEVRRLRGLGGVEVTDDDGEAD